MALTTLARNIGADCTIHIYATPVACNETSADELCLDHPLGGRVGAEDELVIAGDWDEERSVVDWMGEWVELPISANSEIHINIYYLLFAHFFERFFLKSRGQLAFTNNTEKDMQILSAITVSLFGGLFLNIFIVFFWFSYDYQCWMSRRSSGCSRIRLLLTRSSIRLLGWYLNCKRIYRYFDFSFPLFVYNQ